MKYGEQLEQESVPGWSLHNIDYNSLKHHIKVHTTRDQASAIPIPGQQDTALSKFEDELYLELCNQHDRVDLFVSSKADELSRRLEHLSSQVRRLVLRCASSSRHGPSSKRQRRFAKYEVELARCGTEIEALVRFVGAQVVAFRKILKKYRKWTGSAALGSRFRDAVLSHPKSFTRRDLSHLRFQYDALWATLRAATPARLSRAVSPVREADSPPRSSRTSYQGASERAPGGRVSTPRGVQVQDSSPRNEQQGGYWNEYDYDYEGDGDGGQGNHDDYVIYVDPGRDMDFLGLSTITAVLRSPFDKARARLWPEADPTPHQGERSRLLTPDAGGYGATRASYPPSVLGDSSFADTEGEDDSPWSPETRRARRERSSFPSSDDFPAGYAVYRPTSPGAAAAKHARSIYRATMAAFIGSFVLLAVAYLLAASVGRRSRAETEAIIAAAAVASLACACAALTMTVARTRGPGWTAGLVVWIVFAIICVLNGAVLVLVVGNTEL